MEGQTTNGLDTIVLEDFGDGPPYATFDESMGLEKEKGKGREDSTAVTGDVLEMRIPRRSLELQARSGLEAVPLHELNL